MSFLDKLPKLPFSLPFFGNSGAQEEYFFSLNIGANKVIASIWGLINRKLQIINTASSKYESEEDLILAANYALDDALADFEPEPTKILFSVPDFWLQDDDLKPEYLKTLRRMVKELDITPMAYVSTSHAISHLLQKQQGVPLTGILVEISDPLNVAVVKAGKIMAVKTQKRSANLPEDIERALLSFTDIEVMPSKISIYGTENLEKFREEMTSYPWMSQLPFLHLPKIEQLEEDVIIKAVSFAGASEVFPEANISPNHIVVGSVLNHAVSNGPLRGQGLLEEEKVESEKEDMGFVKGDINESEKLEMSKAPASAVKSEKSEVRNFGEEADFGEETAVDRNLQVSAAGGGSMVERRRGGAPLIEEDYDYPAKGGGGSILDTIRNIALTPIGIILGGSRGGLGGVLKILLIPLIVVVGLGAFMLFGPKAEVTVFVDPRSLDKETQIIADPAQKEVDEPNKKIPGSIVETDISGSAKGAATGKKKVGDPAKGAVVLYNKTASSKTLAEGTVLQADNLSFKLDNKVTIASQSAVEGGISFGKANANATSLEIGPDGNLPAGKELSVKGFSAGEVSAKVDQAFSGGVSKDVTVVTSDDQKKLLAQLSSELRTKAKDELQKKLKGDAKVLEESLAEKVTKQSFSKNVNDQASEFTLNLTSNFKGTSYSDTDLRQIVSKLVETNVPEGYMLDLSKTETQADVSKVEKDGKLIFTAKFKAKLMPKLDEEKIKSEIAFKTPGQVEEHLKTIENVIGADIKVNPSLPGPLARLPLLTKNINLHVTAK